MADGIYLVTDTLSSALWGLDQGADLVSQGTLQLLYSTMADDLNVNTIVDLTDANLLTDYLEVPLLDVMEGTYSYLASLTTAESTDKLFDELLELAVTAPYADQLAYAYSL